jgi:hypothetical protein
MSRAIVLALAAAWVLPAPAADKEPSRTRPVGTWERPITDGKTTFTFTAESFQVAVVSGNATVNIEGDYGVTKDGTLFSIVTKVDRDGTSEGPSERDLFRFGFTLGKLTIEEIAPLTPSLG